MVGHRCAWRHVALIAGRRGDNNCYTCRQEEDGLCPLIVLRGDAATGGCVHTFSPASAAVCSLAAFSRDVRDADDMGFGSSVAACAVEEEERAAWRKRRARRQRSNIHITSSGGNEHTSDGGSGCSRAFWC